MRLNKLDATGFESIDFIENQLRVQHLWTPRIDVPLTPKAISPKQGTRPVALRPTSLRRPARS